MPTEAEWEYAGLAGSNDAEPPVGEAAERLCRRANGLDRSALSNPALIEGSSTTTDMAAACDDGYPMVAPVGQFEPNAFGLFDMLGNVWEWTQDCSLIPYPSDVTDGSAVTVEGDCERRATRGGSWRTRADRHFPAFRGRDPEKTMYHIFGFRVARDLDQD